VAETLQGPQEITEGASPPDTVPASSEAAGSERAGAASPPPETPARGAADPYDWQDEADLVEGPAPAKGDPAPGRPENTSGSESPPPAQENADAPQAPPEEGKAHDPALRAVAVQMGLTPEEVDAYEPAQLRAVVDAVSRRDAAWRQHTQAQPKPDPKAPPPAAESDDLDFGVDEEGKPIPESAYDPGIRNALRSLKKGYASKVSELESKVRRMEAREAADGFDRAFESLGGDFKPIFGEGPLRALGQGDAAVQRRLIVVQHAGITEQDTPAVIKNKIETTAKALFGATVRPAAPGSKAEDEARAKAKAETEQRLKDFSKGGVARPTGRQVAEPRGERKAERTAAEIMDQLGYSDLRKSDEEMLAEFPE
jgi:hypothetical protein